MNTNDINTNATIPTCEECGCCNEELFELEIDGETDENGEQAVHNFELYIQKKNADETVSDFESFSLYTGSRAYRKVYYK